MHKRAQNETHPWDGDIEDTRHRSVWVSLLFVALFITSIQPVSAQKVFVFPDRDVPEVSSVPDVLQLSRPQLRVAEDYQEIITKLESLIQHHLDYFNDYENFESLKYQNLLLKTLIKIEKGDYCIDVDLLSQDLSKLTKSLKREEAKLKKDKSLKKIYKNVYTLRNDFEIIGDILEEDIAEQLKDQKSSLDDIKWYLHEKRDQKKRQEDYQITMYELQEQLQEEVRYFVEMRESLQVVFNEEIISELLEAENLEKEFSQILDFVLTIEMPDKIVTVKVPSDSLGKEIQVPRVQIITEEHAPLEPVARINEYDAPEDPQYKNMNYVGKSILSNNYENSILVKSSKIPIHINNQLGDLEVQGWNKNKIVATYSYEVLSDSYDDAKEFVKSISLDISSDKSGIYVASDFPNIHNTKRQIIRSNMIIHVPNKNEVDITNSFGRTVVADFNNNINITTKNSDMSVENINGVVNTNSKNGSSYFNQINGAIRVESNRGDVTIEQANSKLDIVNSHAFVTISDCQGDASLKNSGEILISNHEGNIDIANNNGKTTIKSLDGDLELTGSYKPFYISSINGSVHIENKNAIVMVSDISGETNVMNHGGLIKAHDLQGPVDFTNYGGEILFIANKSLSGNSFIRSDYGKINIVLSEQSNILLQASTEGGSIINSYSTTVQNDDFVSSTTVALGTKSKKLQISGTNATIVIKDDQ